MLFLSMVVCAVFAQNNVGGNVDSKEPISYADKSFLSSILNYDSLKSKPAPYNWPELMGNTFKFTYTTGECRMIPSQFLFDAAEKLGVEKQYKSEQIESNEYPAVVCKLTGIVIQKTDSEHLVRAFYEADDIIPNTVFNFDNRPWYLNTTQKKHFQAIYRPGKGVIKLIDDAYCTYYSQYPAGSFIIDKVYSNFDSISQKFYAHTELSIGCGSQIDIRGLNCKVYKKNDMNNATHTFSCHDSGLYDYKERKRPNIVANFNADNVLIEKKVFDYSIDKMIDSNPATSFVENSVDDNISFIFDYYDLPKNVKKIIIVNGFAKNENLYKANNQIKSIAIKAYDSNYDPICEKTFNLKQTMDFQFIELNIDNCQRLEIRSTELYKGTKYNDTCIAEFDILTDEGWLISGK